jgi:hypothetical protein
MKAWLSRFGRRAPARAVVCAVLFLLVPGHVEARSQLAFLQAAGVAEDPEQSPEEKRAERAARALNQEQRDAARKVRLAQTALVEELMQMGPDERQRFLDENPRIQRLPAPQQRRLRQLTQRLSNLPAEEQTLLLERYRLFLDLSPDQQQQARRLYRHWRLIEAQRRRELLREIEQLREATPEQRRKRLASEEFSRSFSVREQRIVRGLANLLP